MRKFLFGCAATLVGVAGYARIDAAVAQTVPSASELSPGSITVRLNGRVNWYAGIEASSLDDNSASSPSGPCWPLVYHPQMEVTTF